MTLARGEIEMEARPRIRWPVRVLYADTDQGGVVHHAAYLRYVEAARVEFLRSVGIDYRLFEREEGRGLPVAEARLRYRRPARFDDELEVETWAGVVSRAKVRFDSRIWRGEELMTEAEITCACVRLQTSRIESVPPHLQRALWPELRAAVEP